MVTDETAGDVLDTSLARDGVLRVEWAAREMTVMRQITERFRREKPLRGVRIAGCLHITSETANLALALRDGGAEVSLCASNPLSTQDDVAAALVSEYGVVTYAIKGEERDTYYRHIGSVLDHKPNITLDDGADLVTMIHTSRTELVSEVLGGAEETTTGVIRLRSFAEAGKLRPVVRHVFSLEEASAAHRLIEARESIGKVVLIAE